ncbi:MAG: hypothetical protein NC548_05865 [Lachnospiraceae bacterium]|nr:hypothetical protein [Lachnospiraceae bacterium]
MSKVSGTFNVPSPAAVGDLPGVSDYATLVNVNAKLAMALMEHFVCKDQHTMIIPSNVIITPFTKESGEIVQGQFSTEFGIV